LAYRNTTGAQIAAVCVCGLVEGVWFDPFHNYTATVFSKATGDDDDFVMINSFSGKS
jgi:hypothetical protein